MTEAAKETMYCSFCGKSQHDVPKLIAGPEVFICNECVVLCNDIIGAERLPEVQRITFKQLEQRVKDFIANYGIQCDPSLGFLSDMAFALGLEARVALPPAKPESRNDSR